MTVARLTSEATKRWFQVAKDPSILVPPVPWIGLSFLATITCGWLPANDYRTLSSGSLTT
jgi:hypothetical protein